MTSSIPPAVKSWLQRQFGDPDALSALLHFTGWALLTAGGVLALFTAGWAFFHPDGKFVAWVPSLAFVLLGSGFISGGWAVDRFPPR